MTATAIKERPILFSGPMVRAILEGRKTMTRRIVKPQPESPPAMVYGLNGEAFTDFKGRAVCRWPQPLPNSSGEHDDDCALCPYGRIGARLWVRETWQQSRVRRSDLQRFIVRAPRKGLGDIHYHATPPDHEPPRWRPSIHMPRWASRITLEITGVRCERLNEITLSDCVAEGAPPTHPDSGVWDSKETFIQLWESINGDGSWAANPWVWVVEFRRLDA